MKTAPGTLAELATAKRIGDARMMPGSGSLVGAKGDFERRTFKIENKSTQSKVLRLEADWLLKISAEARDAGMVPALAFQFTHEDGRPRHQPWVAIPEWLFKEMLEAYENVD